MENRISAEVTAETINAVKQTIKGVEGYLPFMTSLTNDERINMLKLGDRSQTFVEKSLKLAMEDDSFLPRKFDVAEFKRDAVLYGQVFEVLQLVNALQKKLEDTHMRIGSEAYSGALAVYAAAKSSNRDGELKTSIDELGKLFVKKQANINDEARNL